MSNKKPGPTNDVPFFSVVIPTRNRSFLVGNAIQSVLRQTFPDFELVVVDNDETDATGKVVHAFHDSRLRYLRTGDLNMPDNWEAGAGQARGEYVMMLEDKQALKFASLERIYEAVEQTRPTTVKWLSDAFSDSLLPPRIRLARGDGSTEMVAPEVLLDQFTNELRRHFKQTLPLPQLGCFHRELAEQIKSGVAGRLFHPVSPDVTFACLQLAYSAGVLQINQALVVYTSSQHSNGKSVSLKGALARKFTSELGGQGSIYFDRVPIKAITVPGTVYNDYLKIQSLVHGRLARFPVNWHKYFVECYRAMRSSEQEGVDMSTELEAWHAALALQPTSVQTQVKETLGVGTNQILNDVRCRWRYWERRFGLLKLQRVCKALYRAKIKKDPAWRFNNAMKYIEWEHSQKDR